MKATRISKKKLKALCPTSDTTHESNFFCNSVIDMLRKLHSFVRAYMLRTNIELVATFEAKNCIFGLKKSLISVGRHRTNSKIFDLLIT